MSIEENHRTNKKVFILPIGYFLTWSKPASAVGALNLLLNIYHPVPTYSLMKILFKDATIGKTKVIIFE